MNDNLVLSLRLRVSKSFPKLSKDLADGFRPRRSGACEARLFQFTRQTHVEAEPAVKQVAACDLHESMTYVSKRHAEFDILRVEFVVLTKCCPGRR